MSTPDGSTPYDPERWARGWALTLGLSVLVLYFVPLWIPRAFTRSEGAWHFGWKVHGDSMETKEAVREFFPLLLGAIATAAGAAWSTSLRRYLLWTAGSLAFLGGFPGLARGGATFGADNSRIAVALSFAIATTVASNHLRRRVPRSLAARWGTAAVAAVLLALTHHAFAAEQVWFGVYAHGRRTPLMTWIVPACLAGYGTLTALGSVRRELAILPRLLSMMGRIGPVLGAISVGIAFRQGLFDSRFFSIESLGSPIPTTAAMAARSYVHEFGPVAILSLALCTALEPYLRAYKARPRRTPWKPFGRRVQSVPPRRPPSPPSRSRRGTAPPDQGASVTSTW